MKKVLFSFLAVSVAFATFAQEDGASQPAGSWYLGSGDATQLLHIFSSGVDIAPTVGYAVADDIVVQAAVSGSTDVLSMNLGAAYFMGDYWVGVNAHDLAGKMDLGVGAGRYIPFKDVLFISPNIQYSFGLPEASSDNLSIGIGFGARF